MIQSDRPDSVYLQDYLQFMGRQGVDPHDLQLSTQLQVKYRISMRPPKGLHNQTPKFDVRLVYVGNKAAVAAYFVDIGLFRLTIHVLSLPGKIPTKPITSIGQGSFGTVVPKELGKEQFVAKVCFVKQCTPSLIEDIVREVAIMKLCAAFNIGPKAYTRIPYDIIIHSNAIQFHMERCQTVEEAIAETDVRLGHLEELTDSLSILHALHIVHKDIKPANILWSQSLQKFIFCDFGIAGYIYENIGWTTLTYPEGTRNYMSLEMIRLAESNQEGKADLYYNDVCGLERSITEIKKATSQQNKNESVAKIYLQPSYESENVSSQPSLQYNIQDSFAVILGKLKRHSSQKLEQRQNTARPEFMVLDAYEFYWLVYAATSLDEHQFNLKENLTKLTEEQAQVIYGYLCTCVDRIKMQAVIRQLEALSSDEQARWAHWTRQLNDVFDRNCNSHVPRTAKAPNVDLQTVTNLQRLFGMSETLRDLSKLIEQATPNYNSRIFENIVQITSLKMNYRLVGIAKQILAASQSIMKKYHVATGQFAECMMLLVLHSFSYGTKELLLNDLLSLVSTALPNQREQNYLKQLFNLVLKVPLQEELFDWIQKEPLLQRCVWLFSLCGHLPTINTGRMLQSGQLLLDRLQQQHEKCWYPEIINVIRLHLKVKARALELEFPEVEMHFQRCLRLLEMYGTYDDAQTTLHTLAEQVTYMYEFEFPVRDKRVAHANLEKYRQFYCEIVVDSFTNKLVRNSYTSYNLAGLFENERYTSHKLKEWQTDNLTAEGYFRAALRNTSLVQENGISVPQVPTDTSSKNVQSVINEINLRLRIGRPYDAVELLRSIRTRVASSPRLTEHRGYYSAKSQIQLRFGQYQEALKSCKEAMRFNDKLGPSEEKTMAGIELLMQLGQLCTYFNRRLECLEYYKKARSELGLLKELSRYKTKSLANNYECTAEVLRAMGKLEEAARYCNLVIQLERNRQIPPHLAADAHTSLMLIHQAKRRPATEQLEQAWAVIQKTSSLGDTHSCIAYTLIMEHCMGKGQTSNQSLSFISYARKFTDAPEQRFKGFFIAPELYEKDVAAGLLPLDLPTDVFIRDAETRLTVLSQSQHFACYIFKLRLRKAMLMKFEDQPQYRLFYIRLAVEARLHHFLCEDEKFIKEDLKDTIIHISECEVLQQHEQDKHSLVEFAKNMLQRAKERKPKVKTLLTQKQVPNPFARKQAESRAKALDLGIPPHK